MHMLVPSGILGQVAEAGTTDSALVITAALFGGAGAFLGAVLGQVVQWLRELQAEKRVDRRRLEDQLQVAVRERRDRRYDEYVAAATFLDGLRRRFRHLELMAWVWQSACRQGKPHGRPMEALNEARYDLENFMMDHIEEATARVDLVGSDALRDAFAELNSHSVMFAVDGKPISNEVSSLTEEAERLWQKALAEKDESFGLRDDFFAVSERPWKEVADELHGHASRMLKEVAEIQRLIRTELDLSESITPRRS